MTAHLAVIERRIYEVAVFLPPATIVQLCDSGKSADVLTLEVLVDILPSVKCLLLICKFVQGISK